MVKLKSLLINRSRILALCFLLLLFLILSVLSVQNISSTYDESTHYAYGKQILNGNSKRTGLHGDSNMPFSAWNALPEKIGSFLPAGLARSFLTDFQTERYMTVIFSLLVAYLVYQWSKNMYGHIAGFISLILYIFDPNIIAHSQLVTTDIYAAGMTLIVFYYLWKFAKFRTIGNGLLFTFVLGLSLLAKYTTLILIPLSLISLFLYDTVSAFEFANVTEKLKPLILRFIRYVTITIIILTIVINAGFLFNRTFTNFGNYKFRSDWFQNAKTNFSLLTSIPIPFPYPFLDGIDWMRHTQVTGGNSGTTYLLGKLDKQGFPGYYIIASFFKVPIPTQLIILAALILYFVQAKRRGNFFRDELFLLIGVIFYTIYFNFFFNVQIGIRYYLIIFPLLYVFAGSLFKEWREFRPVQKFYSFALITYLIGSILSYYPYYLTYFNEMVWNRTQGYKYLADSNLDWGQSSGQLSAYLATHPETVFEPSNIQAGHLAIGINHLLGVTNDPSKYAWIRNNFEPVGTIANSILIYQISPSEIKKLKLTK